MLDQEILNRAHFKRWNREILNSGCFDALNSESLNRECFGPFESRLSQTIFPRLEPRRLKPLMSSQLEPGPLAMYLKLLQ